MSNQQISLESLKINFTDNSNPKERLVKAKKFFDEHGFFIAKNLFSTNEIEEIENEIKKIIELRMNHIGMSNEYDSNTDFDENFKKLCKKDRTEGSVIYDACQRLTPVHALSTHPNLLDLMKNLMLTDTLISCNLKAVRIDHPNESKPLFLWHQDYHYMQDSEDAIIVWFVLRDVKEKGGCLLVAPSSHKEGILPVKLLDAGSTTRSIEINDLDVLDKYNVVEAPLKKGEILIFSTLLLHKSQINKSNHTRWTIQLRFGNFEHEKSIKRKWPGRVAEGFPFEKYHPEYVVN